MTSVLLIAPFADKIQPEPMSGCWLWVGAISGGTGYGHVYFSVNGQPKKMVTAHRAVYLASGRTIPNRFQLDHLCKVRSCVNPDHLEPVTQAENNRRSDSPSGRNQRKTHCQFGHELNGNNLIVDPKHGYRKCRTCTNIANNKRFHEKNSDVDWMAKRAEYQRRIYHATPRCSQCGLTFRARPCGFAHAAMGKWRPK